MTPRGRWWVVSDLHLGVDTSQFEPVARPERRRKIGELRAALAELPRGRTPAQTEALLGGLRGDLDEAGLEEALGAGRGFPSKQPDAELEARLDELEGDLDSARAGNEELTGRLDAVRDRLAKSIDKLRGSLDKLESSVAGAGDDADEALGVAGEAARDISVLGNRLDYHLRNHGGG